MISSLQKKQEIEDIYLSIDKDPILEEPLSGESYSFERNVSEIYLIIKAKNLTVDNEINVRWLKLESGNRDNNYSLIQQNEIAPAQNGSGKIVVLLVKRDNSYLEGEYCVEVFLNDGNKISKKFYINP